MNHVNFKIFMHMKNRKKVKNYSKQLIKRGLNWSGLKPLTDNIFLKLSADHISTKIKLLGIVFHKKNKYFIWKNYHLQTNTKNLLFNYLPLIKLSWKKLQFYAHYPYQKVNILITAKVFERISWLALIWAYFCNTIKFE